MTWRGGQPRRRHAQAPQGLRRPVHEHDRGGEAGGILDTILKRLATYIEKNVKLKARSRAPWCTRSRCSDRRHLITVILWKVIPPSPRCSPVSTPSCPCHPVRDRLSNWLIRLLPFIVVGGILLCGLPRYYATYGGAGWWTRWS